MKQCQIREIRCKNCRGASQTYGESAALQASPPPDDCSENGTIIHASCLFAMRPQDIRRFLVWAAEHLGYSELAKVRQGGSLGNYSRRVGLVRRVIPAFAGPPEAVGRRAVAS